MARERHRASPKRSEKRSQSQTRSSVLVTGASGGLGRAFVKALREAGCAKIYAAARWTEDLASDGVIEPIQLDITNQKQVAAAAARCSGVNVLINNAGVAGCSPALGAPTMSAAQLEIETNYLGTLAMCRAFAPILKRNGGGALVNVLSVVSWFNAPMQGTYCISKAAESALTKGIRFELRAQGTLVVGVYAGYIDTDMAARMWGSAEYPKLSPAEAASRVLAGIEHGTECTTPIFTCSAAWPGTMSAHRIPAAEPGICHGGKKGYSRPRLRAYVGHGDGRGHEEKHGPNRYYAHRQPAASQRSPRTAPGQGRRGVL